MSVTTVLTVFLFIFVLNTGQELENEVSYTRESKLIEKKISD